MDITEPISPPISPSDQQDLPLLEPRVQAVAGPESIVIGESFLGAGGSLIAEPFVDSEPAVPKTETAAAPPATPVEPVAPSPPLADEVPTTLGERIRLEVSALSDIGCVRANNEDSFGYDESNGIYVVCDGMGGMASGEVASASTVATMIGTFTSSASSGIPVSTRLLQAIDTANRTVWQQGHAPEHKGMGTTVVAAALDGDKLIIGNVGDSRAYIVESGQCMQLTVDHSYVNELIRSGALTIESASNADLRGRESVITRAIGVSEEVRPDFFSVDLHPSTTMLLATDGLTRYLLQDEIALVLIDSPFEETCAKLIQMAKLRGGHDNITCLLLKTG